MRHNETHHGKPRKSQEMKHLERLGNLQLTAFRFFSESEFNRAVDCLFAKKQSFEVPGFNVLIVPLQSVTRTETILQRGGLKFKRINVVATSDLNRRRKRHVE